MKLTITALNGQGQQSLEKHLEERKTLPKFNPSVIMYNKLFCEEVISVDPFVLEISVKSAVLSQSIRFEDLRQQIERTMFENGSSAEDFEIKEVK